LTFGSSRFNLEFQGNLLRSIVLRKNYWGNYGNKTKGMLNGMMQDMMGNQAGMMGFGGNQSMNAGMMAGGSILNSK
jgi:hypothetical protein